MLPFSKSYLQMPAAVLACQRQPVRYRGQRKRVLSAVSFSELAFAGQVVIAWTFRVSGCWPPVSRLNPDLRLVVTTDNPPTPSGADPWNPHFYAPANPPAANRRKCAKTPHSGGDSSDKALAGSCRQFPRSHPERLADPLTPNKLTLQTS